MSVFMRLVREKKTISVMVSMYCRGRHGIGPAICSECLRVLKYAQSRVDKCPFSESKPQCNLCTVHCYKRDMREKVREIMRYAGPRMLWTHPLLAVLHLLDGMLHKPSP